MTIQTKRKKQHNNKTKKIKSEEFKHLGESNYKKPSGFSPACGFTPFEKDYSKNIPAHQLKISNEKTNRDYIKILNKAFNIPSKISPENNFYGYINYHWLKKDKNKLNKELEYIVQIDNIRLTQNKVYLEIYDIIKNYVKTYNTPESRSLENFAESAYNLNPISNSLTNVKEYILYLDELRKDKNNIWKLLAYINKNDMAKHKCPFVWSIEANPYNSKLFISKISPFIFDSLYIYGIKSVSNYKKKLTENQFNDYLKTLFDTTVINSKNDYKNVTPVMLDIVGALLYENETFEQKTNIIIDADEAYEKYGFNWKELAKELGYKEIPKKFLCGNLKYLKYGTKLLLDNWNSEKWRDFWIWIYVRIIARFTKEWNNIFFEYYGKTLLGQKAETSKEIKCVEYTCVAFNKLINKLYLKKYIDPIKIDFVKNLANDLKIVFKRILTRNDWLAPKTKKYALEKLDALEILLIEPPDFAVDPPFTIGYKKNELYNNLLKYSTWRANFLISQVGKKIQIYPTVSWTSYPLKFTSYQSFVVNAMYIQTLNTIYIPAAYIQKPFVDLFNRTMGYNLATIGFTIAHELSHSLDDKGSKYDKNGDLSDWWTPEDKKKFKQIQDSIIFQYEDWARRDGINYDASKTINEDIADISGLAICNEFLRDYALNATDSVPAHMAFYKLFFIHFAINLRQKLVNEESQLIINNHPPDKYRCDVPLSRSLLFRAIYNVKKGDKMWWPNTNQVW